MHIYAPNILAVSMMMTWTIGMVRRENPRDMASVRTRIYDK
jgi:hypothetical protein